MKKLILLLFFASLCYGQAIYNPKTLFPFINPDDSVLAAGNVESSEMFIGNMLGACVLAIIHDTVATAGNSVGDTVYVYAKIEVNDLGFHTFQDSAVANIDSFLLGLIDSADVENETVRYFDLSNYDWWSWAEKIQIIMDYEESADSLLLNRSILKGQ